MNKNSLTIIAAVFFISCPGDTINAQVNKNDSLALVDFFNSTGGPGWYTKTGWLQGSVNTWFGVATNNGRVIKLEFYDDNNLNGYLPLSIGNLKHLQRLVIDNNLKMTGNIPDTITTLKNLISLSLDGCNFSGKIPRKIGNLHNLITLALSANQFSGTIPSSIGSLSKLQNLWLAHNNFSGSLPFSFSGLTSLTYLSIENNQFQGSVPSMANFTNLHDLFLYHNQFSGPFPDFHNSPVGGECSLSENNFSGPVPDWFKPFIQTSGVFDFINNKFTFDGLEIFDTAYNQRTYYAPQQHIPLKHKLNGNLVVSAGGTPVNNTYRLYKDNVLIATQNGDSTFKVSTPGTYYITVRNIKAPDLELVSDSYTLSPGASVSARNTNAGFISVETQSLSTNISIYNVYPNPANDFVHVQFSADKNFTGMIYVSNMEGKILLGKPTDICAGANSNWVDIHALNAGVYFIQIKLNSEKTEIMKFIKQ
jgi:hypothetical protein